MASDNRLIIGTYDVVVPVGTHIGKRVVLASDHRGFEHKKAIFEKLKKDGYEVSDAGTHSTDRCNYPVYSFNMGKIVNSDSEFETVGIGICGSGMGIIMPAAKFMRVVAARCLTIEDAVLSRQHNNSNIIGISADKTSPEQAINIIMAWLATPFYGDRERDGPYLERYVEMMKLARGWSVE